VDTVAIDAGWHIRVALSDQRRAMNAGEIFLINGIMALRTGTRNGLVSPWQQLTRLRVGQALQEVRIVAVGANGGVAIAGLKGIGVDAV
jgi:hypothetical protein